MSWSDIVTKQYEKELSVIKEAPFACFLTAAVIAAIVIYGFHFVMFTVADMKEDLIKTQTQQITQLKAAKPNDTNKLESDKTPSTPLKVFEKKTFMNEKVLLDGYKYIDCTFENVTLVYNGGPSEMSGTRITFNKSIPFETNNPAVKQVMKIFNGMGVFKPGAFAERPN